MSTQNAVMVIYTSNIVPSDNKPQLQGFLKKIVAGAWKDFKTTNQATPSKAIKFGAGVIGASTIANMTGTQTPLAWILSKFGPLPMEFTSCGTLQVVEYSAGQRVLQMAKAGGIKFVLVTLAYEGGIAVGSVTNQFLSTHTKDAIGGTINEVINHEGWKDLWRHPFGIGLW